jgi:hypothetical protein
MPPSPEAFAAIAEALRPELLHHVPPFAVRQDSPTALSLYGTRPVAEYKQDPQGIFFASFQVMKGHVGLYFFPIYTHPYEFGDLPPALQKCLKGKSCFHLKKLDAEQLANIRTLLQQGAELYQRVGWA